jgi:hypothetical protein
MATAHRRINYDQKFWMKNEYRSFIKIYTTKEMKTNDRIQDKNQRRRHSWQQPSPDRRRPVATVSATHPCGGKAGVGMNEITDTQKLTGVPETLLVALYLRAAETQRADGIIRDEKAVEMIQGIEYDFARFNKAWASQVGVAVRTEILDDAIKEYIKKYPEEGDRKHQDDPIRQGDRTL